MADNVGSIKYDASIDTQGIRRDAKKIEGDLDGVANKGNDTFGKLGTYAKAGMVAAAAAVAAGTVRMLGSMAELEQQIGGSEAVFGQFAKTIQKDATNAYRVAGLSQSEFLQGANKMGSLFQGAGFDVKTSMELSSKAMTRASDVASIMGIDTKFALESIAGAAKGNFTMMDNLGVAMNETTLNAYAMEKGIGKTTQQMTNQEKVGLAMQMFLDKTAKYAGNYAKENDTLAGSLNTSKKAFDDWLSGAGSLSTVISNFGSTIGIAMDTLTTRFTVLKPIFDGFNQALTFMWQQFQPIFANIAANKPLMEFLATIFQVIGGILAGVLLTGLGLVYASVVLVMGVFEGLRRVGVLLGDTIWNVATFFINAWNTIVSAWSVAVGWFNGVVGGIRGAFSAIPGIIGSVFSSAWGAATGVWSGAVSWFGGIVNGIVSWFARLPGQIGAFAQGAWNSLVGAFSGAASIGSNIIRGIVSGLNPGPIIARMKEIASSALDTVKSYLGIHSPSRVFRDQVGKQIGAGMALGISDSASLVSNSASKLSSGLMGTFDNITTPTLGLGGSSSSSAGGVSKSTTIGNIYLASDVDADRFLSRLDADQAIVSSGLAPNRSYA